MYLSRQVRRHSVDVISEIFPRAVHSRHLRLTAELSLRADLARDTCHLGRERVELIDHGIDGVLQFENLAAHVGGHLLREIATRHGGGHLSDGAHLTRRVRKKTRIWKLVCIDAPAQ